MNWPIIDPGIWASVTTEPLDVSRAALFLDRDGVIVEDVGFLRDPADVRLVDGIAELTRSANAAGVPVAVVTNQSGIARGLYGWAEFAAVQTEITNRLAADGARLDAIAACPFHPEFTPDYGAAHDRWRKPAPGMIELLAERLNVDRAGSWLVGDQPRDIVAAHEGGLAGGIILAPGAGRRDDASMDLSDAFQIERCSDMAAATEVLRSHLFGP